MQPFLKKEVRERQQFPQDKWSSHILMGMGSARVMVEGLKRAGRNLTRDTLIEALETIKNFDTEVLSSRITFSKEDHMGAKTSRMVTLVEGKEYYTDPIWVEGLK
jgi:branched-chain amino acid transport system substrate-binding protein